MLIIAPFSCLGILTFYNLHDLCSYFPFVDQAIGECNTRKVDDTIASKYQSISGSDDALVFADFGFHTILYQTPSQGYILPKILRKIILIHYTEFGRLTAITLQYWMPSRTFSCPSRSGYWKATTER